MDRSRALSVLEAEAGRVLSVVEAADPASPVPSCPGWALGQIPDHLGRVYAMVATVLRGNPEQPPDRAGIPRRPAAQPAGEWMRDRLDILLPLLREVPADALRWNFATGPSSPVAFWWRRQAHETLVHRVDVELAAGAAIAPVEPDVAADGVGDFLVTAGLRPVSWDAIVLGGGMTVHLHATDTDAGGGAEWTVDVAKRTFADAHQKADIAVRGPAWALDRWCWRRDGAGEVDELEVFGDRRAAEEWRPAL